MASKRRRGSTLPRQRTRAAQVVAAPRRSNTLPLILAVAGLAVLATIGLIVAGNVIRGGDGETPVVASSYIPITDHSKGLESAPVTIVEYADLQCPVCARFSESVERQIEETYIKTGIVRLEYRHYAFLGEESQRAAEATECAAEQGQFFPYRDTLYANQRGENRGAFSDERLRGFAADLGLDTQSFNACLDSGRYEDRVKAQKAEAERLGVQATPTFFINGRKLEGLAPFSTFQQLIEQAAGQGQ
ncbi:MAG: DsbA family protein [Dehalococcoidia bacterium]